MPALFIFNIVSITDRAKFGEYAERIPATVEAYGGRYLVRGGEVEVFEGDWTPTRLIVIEFPSFEQAKRWYDSEEYEPLKALRADAGEVEGVLVQGLDD